MGADSELVRLVRGEGGALWLNRHERRLLKFALGTFGEALSRFLLTGLGEEAVEPRWHFTVAYAGGDVDAYEGRLQVITHEPLDGQSLLPRWRDPLVLLALLRLLLHPGQESMAPLTYEPGDVLRLLGWPDDQDARRELDEAVGRYSYLTYKWEMSGAGLSRRGLSLLKGREQVLSSYTTVDEEAGGAGRARRVFSRVVFNTAFIDSLRRRSLFDVDWNNVSSLERTQP